MSLRTIACSAALAAAILISFAAGYASAGNGNIYEYQVMSGGATSALLFSPRLPSNELDHIFMIEIFANKCGDISQIDMYHDGEATIVSFQGKPEAHKKIASLIKKYLDIKIRQVQTPPKKYTGPKDPFKPARESSRAVFYKNCDPTGNVSPYRSSTGFR